MESRKSDVAVMAEFDIELKRITLIGQEQKDLADQLGKILIVKISQDDQLKRLFKANSKNFTVLNQGEFKTIEDRLHEISKIKESYSQRCTKIKEYCTNMHSHAIKALEGVRSVSNLAQQPMSPDDFLINLMPIIRKIRKEITEHCVAMVKLKKEQHSDGMNLPVEISALSKELNQMKEDLFKMRPVEDAEHMLVFEYWQAIYDLCDVIMRRATVMTSAPITETLEKTLKLFEKVKSEVTILFDTLDGKPVPPRQPSDEGQLSDSPPLTPMNVSPSSSISSSPEGSPRRAMSLEGEQGEHKMAPISLDFSKMKVGEQEGEREGEPEPIGEVEPVRYKSPRVERPLSPSQPKRDAFAAKKIVYTPQVFQPSARVEIHKQVGSSHSHGVVRQHGKP